MQNLRKKGLKADLISFKAGEQSKNLKVFGQLMEKAHVLGLDRKSAVIALGGGVVGDQAVAQDQGGGADVDPAAAAGLVADRGIDDGVAALTPDRIEKVIRHVLDKESAARLQVYLETCVRCGLCSEACHTYLSRDRDPSFAPVAKVKDTLWQLAKQRGKVSPEVIKRAARIAFTECGACRRCSMYCPFGIDIAYLIMTVRRICSLLEVVPQYLQDTTNSHAAASNQMWVQPDEWIDTLLWQEEEARDAYTDSRIPLDKEGAEVMYSVIAPEPKILAQLLGNMADAPTRPAGGEGEQGDRPQRGDRQGGGQGGALGKQGRLRTPVVEIIFFRVAQLVPGKELQLVGGGAERIRMSKPFAMLGRINAIFEKVGFDYNSRRGWILTRLSDAIFDAAPAFAQEEWPLRIERIEIRSFFF